MNEKDRVGEAKSRIRAAGTGQAGQAKTGPLFSIARLGNGR
jgi:hypothetical protein